jgi:hypothetical protein
VTEELWEQTAGLHSVVQCTLATCQIVIQLPSRLTYALSVLFRLFAGTGCLPGTAVVAGLGKFCLVGVLLRNNLKAREGSSTLFSESFQILDSIVIRN